MELARAATLASSLEAGVLPPAMNPIIPLHDREDLYAFASAEAYAYVGAEVQYRRSILAFGGAAMFATTLGLSALRNRSRRLRAEGQARAQWRALGTTTVYLTSMRLIRTAYGGFESVWISDLDHCQATRNGIEVLPRGDAPLQLTFAEAPSWYVMLRWLHNGSDGSARAPSAAFAGWHPDPLGRCTLRYFDGANWTVHVTRDGVQGKDDVQGK